MPGYCAGNRRLRSLEIKDQLQYLMSKAMILFSLSFKSCITHRFLVSSHSLSLLVMTSSLLRHFLTTSWPLPHYFLVTSSLLSRHFLITSSSLPHHFFVTSSLLPRHFLVTSSSLPHHFLVTSSSLPRHFTQSVTYNINPS